MFRRSTTAFSNGTLPPALILSNHVIVIAMAVRYSELAPPCLAEWPRDIPRRIKIWAFLEAAADLLWMDLCRRLAFRLLRKAVAETRTSSSLRSYDVLALVRVVVRDACVCYPHDVKCLQRSAVVTRMLRRRGLEAKLVIGHFAVPLRWHAWVELDGRVVWDHQTSLAHYHVVDRF